MKRVVVVAIAVGVLVVGGALAWFYSSGNEDPSTELTAPPIAASSASTSTVDSQPVETTSTDEAPGAPTTFTIASSESMVSFALQEELRGVDTTVSGSTDQVAGEILVDFDDPSASVLGDVVVNARTLETESSNRTRTVRGAILDTDTFEFITFSPTSIDGLPTEPTDSFTFTVTGDLTIRDVTRSVTFDVAVSGSEERLEGTASGVVNRNDFELVIPSVPFVANVSEEVTLTIDFVALPG
ncbi:MAG: YceI family protein [Acidimicrobiia bacterium]|nr:YceI family protein [Acidimicrobiia bacterium]MDH5422090.1 YceI family protein [Acidimicrobiia bacterium]